MMITYRYSVADLEGFLGFWLKPPLRFQEASWRFALKLKFLKGSATPFFVVKILVFQVIDGNCVRLGVLLQAKLNLLCWYKLIVTFFWSSTNSELNFFCKTRNLLMKILDPPLILVQCKLKDPVHLETWNWGSWNWPEVLSLWMHQASCLEWLSRNILWGFFLGML